MSSEVITLNGKEYVSREYHKEQKDKLTKAIELLKVQLSTKSNTVAKKIKTQKIEDKIKKKIDNLRIEARQYIPTPYCMKDYGLEIYQIQIKLLESLL